MSSGGNEQLAVEKWKSMVNHMTNVHTHAQRIQEIKKSLHRVGIHRAWIKKGSSAHKSLEKLMGKKTMLNDIKQLSHMSQTAKLEAHHKVNCHF